MEQPKYLVWPGGAGGGSKRVWMLACEVVGEDRQWTVKPLGYQQIADEFFERGVAEGKIQASEDWSAWRTAAILMALAFLCALGWGLWK